jgi:hypothetical protein
MLARDDAATTRISRRAHDRFRWMEELLGDAKLPDGAKCVGLRLALHMNLGSGLCNPGIASLAEGTARTKRGVQKSIARLEQAGRVRCIQGGRGPKHTNRYELLRTNDGSPIFQESEPKSEQEGEPDRLGERTDVQSNSPNNSNTQTAAAADRSARDANLAIVAESLVRQIIALAGVPQNPLPPHWQNPRAHVMAWLYRYPADVIMTGVRTAMARRHLRGEHRPPASVQFFQKPIEEAFERCSPRGSSCRAARTSLEHQG